MLDNRPVFSVLKPNATPEYPAGIYCYYATVDANYNSAYPYVVGPTFYGNKTGANVTTVPASATTFVLATKENSINKSKINVFPNPAKDFITVQTDFAKKDLKVEIMNAAGQLVKATTVKQGTTMVHIETDAMYNGVYFIKVSNSLETQNFKVLIKK